MKTLNIVLLTILLTACASISGPGRAADYADGFSQSELDQMLAPIALYPDSVLSHVLIAATYPLEVVQAARWSRDNPGLDGEAAVDAVEYMDWDPSVKALVAFPELLDRMDRDLEWTQRLGDAFLIQEEDVIASIQYLRDQAYAHGSLRSNEHVRVIRETEYIYIEPARTRYVYVPWYDPHVVYGHWRWAHHPPRYWHRPPRFGLSVSFHWGSGYRVQPAFYFSSIHWSHRQVVSVHHHHHYGGYKRPDRHFRSGRDLARYDGARHWKHNPDRRRGVDYRPGTDRSRFVQQADRPVTIRQAAAAARGDATAGNPRAGVATAPSAVESRTRATAQRSTLRSAAGETRNATAGSERRERVAQRLSRQSAEPSTAGTRSRADAVRQNNGNGNDRAASRLRAAAAQSRPDRAAADNKARSSARVPRQADRRTAAATRPAAAASRSSGNKEATRPQRDVRESLNRRAEPSTRNQAATRSRSASETTRPAANSRAAATRARPAQRASRNDSSARASAARSARRESARPQTRQGSRSALRSASRQSAKPSSGQSSRQATRPASRPSVSRDTAKSSRAKAPARSGKSRSDNRSRGSSRESRDERSGRIRRKD